MKAWRFAGLVGILGALACACVKKAAPAETKTIPSVGKVFVGKLSGMNAVVKGDEARAVLLGGESSLEIARRLVRSQFRFLYGGLSYGHNLKPNFMKQAEIVRIDKMDESTARIVYDVELEVIGKSDAKELPVVVPLRADPEGLVEFVERYGNHCNTMDWSQDDTPAAERAPHFFFFFDPLNWQCPLRSFSQGEDGPAGTFAAMLSLQEKPAGDFQRKAPEYAKIWNDNTLRAVILVAPTGEGEEAEPGSVEAGLDSGLASYNMLSRKLRLKLSGATVTARDKDDALVTLGERQMPGSDVDYIRYEKSEGGKSIDVHLMYARASYLSDVPADSRLKERFHAASRVADMVMYAGHAAYGDNIETLNQWGDFQTGQYLLFYVNSCWSMGYLLDPEAQKHPDGILRRLEAINGGAPWSKHADFILNVESSNMYKASANAVNILDSLNARDKTFVDILGSLSQDAVPVVIGEEDNPDLP